MGTAQPQRTLSHPQEASQTERTPETVGFFSAINKPCLTPLTFIEHGGPPTNNHAERALRPLVIFRKFCMGTRSATGSENISVFASLTQTAALQGAKVIDMFRALFRSSPDHAQDVIFGSQPEPKLSG